MELFNVVSSSQGICEVIQQLELSLLDPSSRKSVNILDCLIDDDFIEFGSSGNIYHKQDLLNSLPHEETKKLTVNDFSIRELSKDVVLVTYKITEALATSLRSSIWKHDNDAWRMVFHQGTKIA